MTEKSWPWSTVAGLGDGAAELNEALSREFLALYFGVQDPTVEGVCKGLSIGELAVSGITSPLSVAKGAGICYGLYINDAIKMLAVSTPAVGTTGGRVVLQTNWAGTGGAGLEARTRLAVKMSADGNPAIPALTHTFGTTWEISLAIFTISPGGDIILTDDRTFRRSTAMVDTTELIDLAVETAKINNLAVTTSKIDNLAVTSGKLGADAVIAGKIQDGAVNTPAKLANDIVDDIKVGNRVPQFYRRQGGSATAWNAAGANNYIPTAVRMQGGSITVTITAGQMNGHVAVTFPVAFSYAPLVIVSLYFNLGFTTLWILPMAKNVTASGFDAYAYIPTSGPLDLQPEIHWLASGPE